MKQAWRKWEKRIKILLKEPEGTTSIERPKSKWEGTFYNTPAKPGAREQHVTGNKVSCCPGRLLK